MFFDAENFIDRVSEISSRLTKESRLTINLAFLVDEALTKHYKSVISQVAESENVDDALKHALAFAHALDERNFDRRLIDDVYNAIRWFIGYYYRHNRWENSEYVGDDYRKRVLRVRALTQCGGAEKKIDKIYSECWYRWAVEPDDLDWDVNHPETSPRCTRRR